MILNIVVPTFYGKMDILQITIKNNIDFLKKVFKNIRYIVVVDFHTTLDYIENYSDILSIDNCIDIYFRRNVSGHKESFLCMNFGMSISDSEYILTMDDDFILNFEYCQSILNEINKQKYGIFLSHYFDEDWIEISWDSKKEGITVGGGCPRVLKKDIIWKYDLFYNKDFFGYMFCDNKYAEKLQLLPSISIINGMDNKTTHLSHDRFLNGKIIDKCKLHEIYYEDNKRKFIS